MLNGYQKHSKKYHKNYFLGLSFKNDQTIYKLHTFFGQNKEKRFDFL